MIWNLKSTQKSHDILLQNGHVTYSSHIKVKTILQSDTKVLSGFFVLVHVFPRKIVRRSPNINDSKHNIFNFEILKIKIPKKKNVTFYIDNNFQFF